MQRSACSQAMIGASGASALWAPEAAARRHEICKCCQCTDKVHAQALHNLMVLDAECCCWAPGTADKHGRMRDGRGRLTRSTCRPRPWHRLTRGLHWVQQTRPAQSSGGKTGPLMLRGSGLLGSTSAPAACVRCGSQDGMIVVASMACGFEPIRASCMHI